MAKERTKAVDPKLVYEKKHFIYFFRRDWQLYALLLLPFLFVIVFKYFPYGGLVIAFKDYKVAKGFWDSKWVGFDIFQKVFSGQIWL